jgi:hypothetical protein
MPLAISLPYEMCLPSVCRQSFIRDKLPILAITVCEGQSELLSGQDSLLKASLERCVQPSGSKQQTISLKTFESVDTHTVEKKRSSWKRWTGTTNNKMAKGVLVQITNRFRCQEVASTPVKSFWEKSSKRLGYRTEDTAQYAVRKRIPFHCGRKRAKYGSLRTSILDVLMQRVQRRAARDNEKLVDMTDEIAIYHDMHSPTGTEYQY